MKELFKLDSSYNGKGPVVFAWQKEGNFLAVAGVNRRVHIVDRQGKDYFTIPLPGGGPGPCTQLDWDCTGEVLAILQQGASTIPLWNFNTKKLDNVDTNMKDLTFIKWSKVGSQLAVGTAKGNLLIYDRKKMKKVPIVGKHQKRITCGAWNSQNRLALGAEDKQLTISNTEGDTLDSAHMKNEPSLIQFSDMKADERAKSKENTVSVNMGGKTLLLYNTTDQDNPIELAFQQRYGNIVSYKWFGDGYILIGFSSGYVVVISTHLKEIGQEVNSIRFHRDNLTDVTFSPALQKGASIGDNCVKIFDMSELSKMSEQRSEKMELDNEFGTLTRVDWTEDGQILTVSSKHGYIYTFLTRIPALHDVFGTRVLFLESLRDLRVKDMVDDEDIARIRIEIEPSFVSLGPNTVAVGMNNRVWFYRLADHNGKLQQTRSYLSTVQTVRLSREYAAVFTEGRVTLHPIDQTEDEVGVTSSGDSSRHRVFPEKDDTADITVVAMTEDFLIYGTSRGTIHYFSLEDWCYVNEFRFSHGIRQLYPNNAGTRVVFVDQTNAAYLYSPVNDQAMTIEKFSPSTEKVMWDTNDWGIFYGADNQTFTTYIYSPNSRWGPTTEAVTYNADGNANVQTTDRPYGFVPILCYNGNMVCQRKENGQLATITMQTHQYVAQSVRLSGEQVIHVFYKYLALHRLDEAWKIACQLNLQECWCALGDKALHLLDVNMAIRVHRKLERPAMVMSLERLAHVNEKNLLLGHVALMFKNFSEAQSHFMRSTRPTLALDMRRDLMHWDVALKLAEQLSPQEIPIISREYAQQLEFKGEVQSALDMYYKGMMEDPQDDENGEEADYAMRKRAEHNKACTAGVARMTIRMGDIRKGFNQAIESGDNELCIECAQIFEEMKQWTDAAGLYEKAGMFDKAAHIHIQKEKNLSAAAKLLPRIKSPKILIEFGKGVRQMLNVCAHKHSPSLLS